MEPNYRAVILRALDLYIASMVRQETKLRKDRLEGPASVYLELATEGQAIRRKVEEGALPLDFGPGSAPKTKGVN